MPRGPDMNVSNAGLSSCVMKRAPDRKRVPRAGVRWLVRYERDLGYEEKFLCSQRWDILPGVPEEVRRVASDQPYVQVSVWKGFHEVGIGSGEEGAGGCPECVNNRARSQWKQRSPREWRKVTRNESNISTNHRTTRRT